MMIAEEIAQTMIPEDNCTAQRYHVLGEFKNKRLCHLNIIFTSCRKKRVFTETDQGRDVCPRVVLVTHESLGHP
jgi:hypothetical protein